MLCKIKDIQQEKSIKRNCMRRNASLFFFTPFQIIKVHLKKYIAAPSFL